MVDGRCGRRQVDLRSPNMYATTSLTDLAERTEYEAWLLEAVYKIAEHRLTVLEDGLVYPPDGGAPTYTIGASLSINMGDWRPGFLKAGAPLVFVTAFKLLDMLLEWVLVENGQRSTHRFVQKIAAHKNPTIVFPSLIETRPWLRERLVALYEHFEPLRGTLIHARHFSTTDGELSVSSSKGGAVGPAVGVSAADLRNFALLAVAIIRYIEGSWTMDPFREKRVRRAFDDLAPLHRAALLGQLPPALLFVRVFAVDADPIEVDLDRIRADIAARQPGQDIVFNLRVIVMAGDGATAGVFLFPWSEVQGSHLRKSLAELAAYSVPLPTDVDVTAAARAMKLTP